jgi:hypothetical protein
MTLNRQVMAACFLHFFPTQQNSVMVRSFVGTNPCPGVKGADEANGNGVHVMPVAHHFIKGCWYVWMM